MADNFYELATFISVVRNDDGTGLDTLKLSTRGGSSFIDLSFMGAETVAVASALVTGLRLNVLTGKLELKTGVAKLEIRNGPVENAIGSAVDDLIAGNAKANRLEGRDGSDHLIGEAGNDTLIGDGGGDRIEGGTGADLLYGGSGADLLSGGASADVFLYRSRLETGTTAATRDVIKDFQHGVDRIHLSAIDANILAAGNQAFLFVGGRALSGRAGELHVVRVDGAGTANDRTVIGGDVNGDGISDFHIQLTGLKTITAADFVL